MTVIMNANVGDLSLELYQVGCEWGMWIENRETRRAVANLQGKDLDLLMDFIRSCKQEMRCAER